MAVFVTDALETLPMLLILQPTPSREDMALLIKLDLRDELEHDNGR